jgi:GntR family transcriptional regulator, histidine utilization repressor
MSPRTQRAETSSLHRRIRADIERRILSGAWPPGHRIPFEHEIMKQYGCARMTANKAIAALADAGLIIRRRRIGSFVAEPPVHAVVMEIPDIPASVRARGQTPKTTLHEQTLAGNGELLELHCLHHANDRPFALEQRLIALSAVPEALTIDFAHQPPGTWLLSHVAWTQAEHRIRAINATREIAQRLQIAERDACLSLERRTWRGDEHITHVTQIFPGMQYDLLAHFEPNK